MPAMGLPPIRSSSVEAERQKLIGEVLARREQIDAALLEIDTHSKQKLTGSQSTGQLSVVSAACRRRAKAQYMPPVAPAPTWPTLKPPTLDQMERKMKQLSEVKDLLSFRAKHEGRTQEAARVVPIIEVCHE
jgi:hypothetical protein